MSRAQSAIRFQEGPYLIERRLPCLGDIADGYFGADCCHRFRQSSFHHNIVFHLHGPFGQERRQLIAMEN